MRGYVFQLKVNISYNHLSCYIFSEINTYGKTGRIGGEEAGTKGAKIKDNVEAINRAQKSK